MKKIKLITLTDEEKNEVEISYNEVKEPQISLDEIISKNNNQTYIVLKHIGNSRKDWGDIEDMVTYTDALKKVNSSTTTTTLKSL